MLRESGCCLTVGPPFPVIHTESVRPDVGVRRGGAPFRQRCSYCAAPCKSSSGLTLPCAGAGVRGFRLWFASNLYLTAIQVKLCKPFHPCNRYEAADRHPLSLPGNPQNPGTLKSCVVEREPACVGLPSEQSEASPATLSKPLVAAVPSSGLRLFHGIRLCNL